MPDTLTTEEFNQLSPFSQEDFLNDGGLITASILKTESMISPVSEGYTSSVKVEGGSIVVMGNIETPQPSIFPSSKIPERSEGPLGQEVDNEPYNKEQSGGNVNGNGSVVQVQYDSINQNGQQYSKEDQETINQWTEGFDIEDPVDLLYLLDDDIKNGITSLHKWQVEFMLDFANGGHTKDNPFYAAVQAANGSGKDKYVVAACVVWLCMRYNKARGVVTNGSGTQLDNQTERYVRDLCDSANLKFAGGKELIWKCNYRYYECIPTQSPIILFATDEPNKAEGYHPLKSGGKMAIFASEAKAIPDTIFTALTRCTGFTHRVDVSSPGLPMGYFYNVCTNSLNRKTTFSVIGHPAGTVILYHITAFDCPHITINEIKAFADKLPSGENDPVYISGVLAQFTTTDEMVVIPYAFVHWGFYESRKASLIWIQESYNKGGLDLSDGGAETCLVVRNGNKHIKTIPFKFQDTQDTITFLEEKFKENNLINKEALVFADCCGIGKPMIDALRRRGWSNMRYVDSRHSSSDKRVYFNRGTELFFNVRTLLERHELLCEYDKLLMSQLAGRYYKLRDGTVRQLLTKLEQKSRGYPSPDRADAFNLAFWDYKSTRVFNDFSTSAPSSPITNESGDGKPTNDFSLRVWAGDSQESLASFQKNIANKRPTNYLERELERYITNRKN